MQRSALALLAEAGQAMAHELMGAGAADPFEEKCSRPMMELGFGIVQTGLGVGEERNPQRAFFARAQA